jgi:RNA polymerase sigma-70 factor (ECF subfamily)
MNENAIIKKLQAGDLEVLEAVWKEDSARLLNLAFRILLDRDAAEDILMDVFVSIPETIKRFRGESSISTWLYRMTTNACLMKIRNNKRRIEILSESHEEIEASSIGHKTEELPIYEVEALERGLAKLTPEMRSLLWLKDADGLDLKSLVHIFNAPEGTLKARLSRARTLVRQALQEEVSYA